MRYRLLGPIEVENGARPFQPRGSKQRALLAILLLHANEVVSRDVLIDQLWGERPPSGAPHCLEAHVSRLRSFLRANGEEGLVTRPGGYRLEVDDDDLDLARFDRFVADGRQALRSGNDGVAVNRLREALALWRGPPLEDVRSEPFAQIEVERLESRRLGAFEDLFEAQLSLGITGVVDELDRLARDNPLRERLQAQLMLALYRCGRQREALDVYRRTRTQLVTELGLEPGAELRELEQAVLRQDPSLDAVLVDAEAAQPDRSRPRRRSRRLLALPFAAAAVTGAALAIVFLRDSSPPVVVGPNSVGVVDARSGRIVKSVATVSNPVGLAWAGDRVWVANLDRKTITRFDPAGNVVDVLSTGGAPTAIAAVTRAVWVADGFAGKLVRLDVRTGDVTASVPLGGHPAAVAIDGNGVWVANTVLDAVQHIDPRTLEVTSIPVGSGPSAIAADGMSVWVANGLERSLTRINSVTGTITAKRVSLPSSPGSLAIGDRSIWVTEPADDAVARLDANSGRPQATVRVTGRPSVIVETGGYAWVGDTDARSLTEISASSDRVERTVDFAAEPRALLLADGDLWVAAARP